MARKEIRECTIRSRGTGDVVGRQRGRQQIPDCDKLERALEGVSDVRAKKGFRGNIQPSKSAGTMSEIDDQEKIK